LRSALDAFQIHLNAYDDPDSPLQLPEVTKTFDWEAVARQLNIRFVSVDPGVTDWITAYMTDAFFDTRKYLSPSPIPSDTTRQRIHNTKALRFDERLSERMRLSGARASPQPPPAEVSF